MVELNKSTSECESILSFASIALKYSECSFEFSSNGIILLLTQEILFTDFTDLKRDPLKFLIWLFLRNRFVISLFWLLILVFHQLSLPWTTWSCFFSISTCFSFASHLFLKEVFISSKSSILIWLSWFKDFQVSFSPTFWLPNQ